MLVIDDASDTFDVKVLVQFNQKNGAVKQGDFMATFKRLPQDRIDELLDEDAGYTRREVLDEALVSVSGIGRTPSEELPAEQQLDWVKRTPECVGAAFVAFLRAMRPERYIEGTSKKRYGRG